MLLDYNQSVDQTKLHMQINYLGCGARVPFTLTCFVKVAELCCLASAVVLGAFARFALLVLFWNNLSELSGAATPSFLGIWS